MSPRLSALCTLLAFTACATPRPAGPLPATAPLPTPAAPVATTAPPAASAALPEAPPTFAEVRAGFGGFCGRTAAGAMWCWGLVDLPGEAQWVQRSRPTRIEGLPALSGFTLVGRSIVGWEANGSAWVVARDPYSRGDKTIAVHPTLPVQRDRPAGGVRFAPQAMPAKIAAAAGNCLSTTSGELLCALDIKPDFVRMPFPVRAPGSGPCAIDAEGFAIAFHLSEYTVLQVGAKNLPVPAYTPVRIEALGQVSSVACRLVGKGGTTVEGCGLSVDGVLRCSSERLQALADGLREGRAATAVSSVGSLLCIQRDDGQARCDSSEDVLREASAGLVGVDARRGVAATYDGVMCTAGGDGTVRCWGEVGSPALGDGSVPELAAPVHLPSYDGADLISHEGGITCVRTAPTELRCFGRIMFARVEPAPVPLPEPIDRMVGAFPLCVRGAKSRSWYCRDPYSTFFAGSLPGGWEAMRDARGQPLGTAVRSVAVSSATGIHAALASGEQVAFFFRGTRQRLLFSPAKLYDGPVAELTSISSALRPDGSGVVRRAEGLKAVPGPVTALEPPCLIRGAELSCWDRHDASLVATSMAEDVVQLAWLGLALTRDGRVLRPKELDEPVRGLEVVAGLPPMQSIAGRCGLSKERQVWCWGTHSELDGPRARLEAKPVLPDVR
ncbi:MAG TPA: hypothetical protein VGK67_19875 [Myxococcales bacterium]|jgi:hypothetical protein